MKFAQFTLVATLTIGLSFISAATFANPIAATPIVKQNGLCPTWPTCPKKPNEEKPPRKVF